LQFRQNCRFLWRLRALTWEVSGLAISHMKSTTLFLVTLLAVSHAQADAVTDWNERSCALVVAAGLGNQPAHRVLAIAHTAALRGAEAMRAQPEAMESAIAAAHRTVLMRLLPAQQPGIDAAYREALGARPHHQEGASAGVSAAETLLAERENDGAGTADSYRPYASPGRYVPTTLPAAPHWGQRRPWLMARADQFRPAPVPQLDSARWARDFQETQALGAKSSHQRNGAQTDIARFWDTSAPPVYHELVRNVAAQPGRGLLHNARLFAAFTQAVDDAMVAVFDAKYQYAAWRPITAIRNADIDGNDATLRDSAWSPLLSTPMHPEYPCAHCAQAAVVAAVLRAELGTASHSVSTHSASAAGAERRWATLDDFVREVGDARVYGGVHFRFSVEAGTELGRRVGELAAARHLSQP
jgi:hypothetical protein